jgi:hypothetical protein
MPVSDSTPSSSAITRQPTPSAPSPYVTGVLRTPVHGEYALPSPDIRNFLLLFDEHAEWDAAGQKW